MSGSAVRTPHAPRRRGRLRAWPSKREHVTAYLFVLPALLLVGVFGLFPIGYAFYMSLHRWRIRQGSFIGFEHYVDLVGDGRGALAFVAGAAALLVAHALWRGAFARTGWRRWRRLAAASVLMAGAVTLALGWRTMVTTGDEEFLASLVVTLFYALGTVPLQVASALLLASALTASLRARSAFRMIYFVPYITPQIATAVVFAQLFSPRGSDLAPGGASVANKALGAVGVDAQRWLFEPRPVLELLFGPRIDALNAWLTTHGVAWQWEGLWLGPSLALVAIIAFGVWTYTGLNVVVFLAGLSDVPKELYEAAQIDGANGRQRFWNITLPILSPVTYYLTLLGFIGALQAFSQIYVMRSPFARGTVDTASVLIFDTFYKSNDFSLAAAQSILLFLLILFATFTQQRVLGRRVFYG